jgi:mannose-1-phosphate guanylyltransferase
MFVVTARVLLAEGMKHCPELTETVRMSVSTPENAVVKLGDEFLEAESLSLDHAIMEKTARAVVLPIDVGWSDIGSYDTLWEASDKDSAGNAVSGDVVLSDVSDSLVRASSRTVAVAGLSGVVVIETPDTVLVVPRERSQDIKELAADAERSKPQSSL